MRYSPRNAEADSGGYRKRLFRKNLARNFQEIWRRKICEARIAREIAKARKTMAENNMETGELVEIISKAVPENYKKGKHPFRDKSISGSAD